MTAFSTAHQADYLATEVMTASPARLRLMLIEAALRQAHRARECWAIQANTDAAEAIIRCQLMVGELMTGLNPQLDQELAQRIHGVYMFVFRTLVQANLKHDAQLLSEVESVLEVQRDTWRQVVGQGRPADGEQRHQAMPLAAFGDEPSRTGFSLRA